MSAEFNRQPCYFTDPTPMKLCEVAIYSVFMCLSKNPQNGACGDNTEEFDGIPFCVPENVFWQKPHGDEGDDCEQDEGLRIFGVATSHRKKRKLEACEQWNVSMMETYSMLE